MSDIVEQVKTIVAEQLDRDIESVTIESSFVDDLGADSLDAVEFLTKLKRNLIFLDISNAKMEDGSLRVDVNISIAPVGSKQLGQRVEIKNINSFANVIKAINYEIKRQTELILKNEKILFATMR